MGDEFHLVKTFGPAAKLNLILKAIFFFGDIKAQIWKTTCLDLWL